MKPILQQQAKEKLLKEKSSSRFSKNSSLAPGIKINTKMDEAIMTQIDSSCFQTKQPSMIEGTQDSSRSHKV